jgi:phosphoribosyl 1,2-cyclic phosphate phosphodiesterase
MKITFLGTGTSQGVPVVACSCDVCLHGSLKDKRLRSSVLIEAGEQHIVIDAGPDFRQQLLRENICRLDAILITHRHKDHIAGLDDVRSFNWFTGRSMPVYATAKDQERIRQEFSYAFSDTKYPGVPSFDLKTITEEKFNLGQLEIQPLEILHMKMEIMGFRIGDFAYLTDTNYIPGEVISRLSDCKVVVVSALRHEKHISHYTLEEAVEVLSFIRPERAYLTHLSHLMGFHDQVEEKLPPFIRIAYDGLSFEIPD